MDNETFNQTMEIILSVLPEEFRAAVSYSAWESGHSAGYQEVIEHAKDTIDWLLPCIVKFEKRIT